MQTRQQFINSSFRVMTSKLAPSLSKTSFATKLSRGCTTGSKARSFCAPARVRRYPCLLSGTYWFRRTLGGRGLKSKDTLPPSPFLPFPLVLFMVSLVFFVPFLCFSISRLNDRASTTLVGFFCFDCSTAFFFFGSIKCMRFYYQSSSTFAG